MRSECDEFRMNRRLVAQLEARYATRYPCSPNKVAVGAAAAGNHLVWHTIRVEAEGKGDRPGLLGLSENYNPEPQRVTVQKTAYAVPILGLASGIAVKSTKTEVLSGS
jgi:hypothetical protein